MHSFHPKKAADICTRAECPYYPVKPNDNPAVWLPLHVMPLRDTQLNTPAEMFVRLVYVARFLFFLISLICGVFTLSRGSLHDVGKLAVFLAAMITCHLWLKRRGKLDACDRALEAMFNDTHMPADADLDALLERRQALEEKRGTPGFDPWAMQAVRREISDYLRLHPESTRRLDPMG